MPSPCYIISRAPDAGGEVDPAAPLHFWPERDSDELYEALKQSFPHVRTHKERVREAVIQFHLQEREHEAMMAAAASSMSMSNVRIPRTLETMW